ncbi:MAG: PorP/SprF family type IX secretion system membrane protein [Robiginitalea sp.]|jgi:type IX secretion system PorP/SprF family membrane protein
MKFCRQTAKALRGIIVIGLALCAQRTHGQETPTDFRIKSPFHNQLFFNRFLINPTFSLVRENKSYLNILHRNQYASFEDNIQNYYLGFSNKMNENTALGIGLYGQWEGVMQEFGFNANYATSVRLGSNTRLAFGTNVTYVSQGLDRSRMVTQENDPTLLETGKQSKIAIQPGTALSLGRFDIGLYARNLIEYNQTTNELVTGFNTQNLRASLQYTHYLQSRSGLFAGGRIMPLLQFGQGTEDRFNYIGSLLLDLPEYGWFQTTYDNTYGLSMGLGFNLNRRLSIGYLMEKDLSEDGGNLGWNHELSLAYTFKEDNGGSESYVADSKDAQIDAIVRNYEEQILELRAELSKEPGAAGSVEALAYENRLILDELMWRQDSVEKARNALFEKKFETMVRLVRQEIREGDAREPVREQRAYQNRVQTAVASATPATRKPSRPLTRKDFRELPIKAKNRSDIVGVSSGYYLIANVYKNEKYLNAFMKSLKQKGLNAKQFYNTENGLYYVYLADFHNKAAAKNAYVSNLQGRYRDEKWIMEVYNPAATAQVSYKE